MTDLQFESLLTQKAATLPRPAGPLLARAKAPPRRRPALRLVLAAAALLACLLGIGAYAYTGFGAHGLWMSYYSADASTVQQLLRREGYDLTVPDTLGSWPMRQISKASAAPHGTEYAAALLDPRYVYYTFDYGDDGEPAPLPEDPSVTWYPDQVYFTLTVGGTQDDYWAYCFGYDTEAQSFPLPQADEQGYYEDLGVTEYRGRTVWLRRRVRYDGGCRTSADWLSPDGSLVLGITVFAPDEGLDILPLVQEFIDQNS